MLCPRCGYYTEAEEIVCPQCGEVLKAEDSRKESGAQAIRQGKRAREAVRRPPSSDPAGQQSKRRRSGASRPQTLVFPPVHDDRSEEGEYSETADDSNKEAGERTFERRYRQLYDESGIRDEQARRFALQYEQSRKHGRSQVNWVKTGFVILALLIAVLVGGWLFLTRMDAGQRIMARLGREANSTALWAVGDEQLNSGDIDGAISSFERAKAQDEAAGIVDVDGLLLLGNAYEAAGMIDEAAALYELIYTETPSRTEAYVNHIRILRASEEPGDIAKAGELMKTAYEKTGDESFRTQRRDLLPAPPEVDLTAGYYETKKYILITSYQGYDVYYTFDENAELPSGGTLFTERVFLDEGIHTLRAVAVNGELVSDELRGTYKIIMPSPQTPRATLAPNTYKSRQRVRLKPGLDNENDDDIVIYYTIDGSPPDADSPIFRGEAIVLPSGWVTLKAVAVNKYGKVSNTLEVLYKIEAKPFPLTGWKTEETVSDLKLYQTTMIEFQKAFGDEIRMEPVELEHYTSECRKYVYSWGYAVMNRTRTGWVLAELYMTNTAPFKLPRGTGIGDTEAFVIGKFRDMGQLAGDSGNRGLYDNSDGTGKILVQDDGTRIIRYRCSTTDGRHQQMDYHINSGGTVFAVDWSYDPI